MKRVFLLIVVPVLLVAMGLAQTPAASGTTDQVNIKGCLGGSNGNYTVAENSTGTIFKITTSRDLQPYLGQDVNVIGHKAGTAENSVAATEVNMISEHCTAAAAAPAATVSAPGETIIAAPAAATAPAPAAPAASVSTPAETVSTPPAPAVVPDAAAPSATVSTTPDAAAPDATVSAPPAAAAPDATASTPPSAAPATVSKPAETAGAAAATPVHRVRKSAQPQTPTTTPDAAAAPAEPSKTPVADEALRTEAYGAPTEPAVTPAVPAAAAVKPTTSRSKWMLSSIVVALVLMGILVPLFQRWRRRKLSEETSAQNLSFTKEVKSDSGESEASGGRKAA